MKKFNLFSCKSFHIFNNIYFIICEFTRYIISNTYAALYPQIREHQKELEEEGLRNLPSRQDATFVKWFESRVSKSIIICYFLIIFLLLSIYIYSRDGRYDVRTVKVMEVWAFNFFICHVVQIEW